MKKWTLYENGLTIGHYKTVFGEMPRDLSTLKLDDSYTIDVPVIRGIGSDRRFDLYKECEEDTVFVFSVEFFFKDGQDRYSHGQLYDAEDALKYIDEFMAGFSIFDKKEYL